MKIVFDTGVVINCVLDESFLDAMDSQWKQNENLLIMLSTVEVESINKLVRMGKFKRKEDGATKVTQVITKLSMKRENRTQQDVKEGWKLTKKYGDTICHPPDNMIISHSKRLGVDKILTCDSDFAEICGYEKIGTFLYYVIS